MPLPLAVTALLFPRDPGQDLSSCAQFNLQLCGPFHASRDGCCGCQLEWHCQPSPPAAGAVPWLIPGEGLQAQESNLECLWVKADSQLPGPGFLGEARESSSSVAGTQQVTRQTFQSLQSLTWGWAVDQAPSLVESYYLALCAHCPWGCLGRIRRNCF